MVRLGRRRQMERQEVGAGADLVERQQLDAHALGDLARDERIVGDDPHPEGAGALRHLLADAAEAGDAERLAAQLGAEEALLLPLAVLHRPIGGGHAAGERQHQGAGVLGDADAVRARRVDDENAARAGGGHVDVVDAGAGAGDDPELRRRGQQVGGDLRRAADEQRVGVRQRGREFRRRAAAPRVDLPAGLGAEQLERRCRQVVGDDYLDQGLVRLGGLWAEAADVSSLDSICRWSESGCRSRACPSAGTPSRMTVKISPSVWPCFQSASVRSDGVGFSSAPALPSPLPLVAVARRALRIVQFLARRRSTRATPRPGSSTSPLVVRVCVCGCRRT